MIRTDYHVHTSFSTDGKVSMEEMLKQANALGLYALCFTDHMDYDFPESYVIGDFKPPYFVFDDVKYWDALDALDKSNPHPVAIRRGVELGLRPDVREKNRALLEAYPWDFAIGSLHLAFGRDPYREDYWEGVTEEEGLRRYFEATLACVEGGLDFDVLGHMDYVFRYAPSKNRLFSYRRFGDLWDAVLEALIQRGRGLEVNSSGLKAGLGMPHPHPDILTRYRELGGEVLSVGSDAHETRYLGYRFGEIRDLLLSLGFRYYTVFQGRQAESLPL